MERTATSLALLHRLPGLQKQGTQCITLAIDTMAGDPDRLIGLQTQALMLPARPLTP